MYKEEIIAGIDEAGRGCIAGPVVAAAVILPDDFDISILKDSKKLTEKKRKAAFLEILQKAVFAWGQASNIEVDKINIKKATNLAMQRAVDALCILPEKLLIDGNDKFQFDIKFESIIKGDDKIPQISAASIIAKVIRDQIMTDFDKIYPQFLFYKHKGYGTKAHFEAVKRYKPCKIHRFSFEPVKSFGL